MKSFARQHTHPFIPQFLIRAEQKPDFPRPGANIPSRHIRVFTDVFAQLGHEWYAESADFIVGLALWVEVGSAFPPTHRKASQGIFEGLLESQKFQYWEVDGGV
jgi:hypothetical protein